MTPRINIVFLLLNPSILMFVQILDMKRYLIFLFLLTASIFKIQAQTAAKNKLAFQQVLDHHNKVRKEVGVPPLQMSSSLSAYAQQWAEHLAKDGSRIYHSDCEHPDGRSLGENIFWGSSSVFDPVDASNSWYEEKKDYQYAPVGSAINKGVGHYTQMVWKYTKEMGLGIAYTQKGGIIVVASYYPAGNIIGSYPY